MVLNGFVDISSTLLVVRRFYYCEGVVVAIQGWGGGDSDWDITRTD